MTSHTIRWTRRAGIVIGVALLTSTAAGTTLAGSDFFPPVVGKPDAGFSYNVTVAKTTKPIKVVYRFTVDDQSGIADTTLEQKLGSGAFTDVALPSSTAVSVTRNIKPSNTTVRTLRASAMDQWHNQSGYTEGDPFKVRVLQAGAAGFVLAGTWKPASSSNYYGGTVSYASAAAAAQEYSGYFSDAALVFTRGPNMGKVKIYWDSILQETIDLYSASPQYRKVLFTIDLPDPGNHIIKLIATGTKNAHSTGKRVEFDALLLMNP